MLGHFRSPSSFQQIPVGATADSHAPDISLASTRLEPFLGISDIVYRFGSNNAGSHDLKRRKSTGKGQHLPGLLSHRLLSARAYVAAHSDDFRRLLPFPSVSTSATREFEKGSVCSIAECQGIAHEGQNGIAAHGGCRIGSEDSFFEDVTLQGR
ncbi:hypothetical protein NL676_028346 [Syzygium grande]|nr:hypothetical protein NL676_028346 [Syzygium grande]